MVDNVIGLLKQFSSHSPFSAPLEAALTKGMNIQQARMVTHKPLSTLKRHRSEYSNGIDNSQLITTKYPLGVKRQRISLELKEFIHQFIADTCHVKSGTEYHVQRCTNHQLFLNYEQHIIDTFPTIDNNEEEEIREEERKKYRVCERTFHRIKNQLYIHRYWKYDGQFDCLRCVEFEVMKGNEKKKNSDEYKKLEWHQMIRDHQRKQYQYQCDNVKEREMVLTIDFTKYDTKQYLPLRNDGEEDDYITDMIGVAMTRNKESGKVDRKYIHWLCSKAGTGKNDVDYVRESLERGKRNGLFKNITKLYLWSDGGPKHFKNVYAMKMIAELIEKWGGDIQVEWNFFASYHGHSLCDSQAGVLKRKANDDQQSRRQNHGSGVEVRSSGRALGDLIEEQLNDATAIVLSTINRKENRELLYSLKGTKMTHSFQFMNGDKENPNDQIILMREKTNEGEWKRMIIKKKTNNNNNSINRSNNSDNGDSKEIKNDHLNNNNNVPSLSSQSNNNNNNRIGTRQQTLINNGIAPPPTIPSILSAAVAVLPSSVFPSPTTLPSSTPKTSSPLTSSPHTPYHNRMTLPTFIKRSLLLYHPSLHENKDLHSNLTSTWETLRKAATNPQ